LSPHSSRHWPPLQNKRGAIIVQDVKSAAVISTALLCKSFEAGTPGLVVAAAECQVDYQKVFDIDWN
jgi:hypothetical protein